jgi:nucleoside-diphosphate-sugar epimerase
VDAAGRHSNSERPPTFDEPISESHPTLRPGNVPPNSPEGYAAHKIAAEEVLLSCGRQVSVLRAAKVHGAFSRRPREWMFVKRVLDRRRLLVLVDRGTGGDHPAAAANIAALIGLLAGNPGGRLLNIADPDNPSPLAIARIVASHLGYTFEEVLLDTTPATAAVGCSPWHQIPPIELDTTAAADLGYQPVGNYAETVTEEIDWLISAVGNPALIWAVPTADDPFFAPLLDYAAEDRYLEASGRANGQAP